MRMIGKTKEVYCTFKDDHSAKFVFVKQLIQCPFIMTCKASKFMMSANGTTTNIADD